MLKIAIFDHFYIFTLRLDQNRGSGPLCQGHNDQGNDNLRVTLKPEFCPHGGRFFKLLLADLGGNGFFTELQTWNFYTKNKI